MISYFRMASRSMPKPKAQPVYFSLSMPTASNTLRSALSLSGDDNFAEYSKLVYSTQASDVEHVMIDGKWVLKDRNLTTIDMKKTVSSVNQIIRQFIY